MNLRWTVRDAWKCISLIFILYLVLLILIVLCWPILQEWNRSQTAHFVFRILDFFVLFIPTLYFARIKSFSDFKITFGLNLKPSKEVWLAIAWLTAIQGSIFIAAHFGSPNRGLITPNLKTATQSEIILYFLPFLIAPFWEEVVMRGFFYRAFRSSYSKFTSVFLVVGITAFTHQSQFFGSIMTAIGLSGFVIVLCWLMERSNKIWNCILAHLAFNVIFILTCFMPR